MNAQLARLGSDSCIGHWSPHAWPNSVGPYLGTMLPRHREATSTIDGFMSDTERRNRRLIARLSSPKDEALAVKSWTKTEDEIKRGIAIGPFDSLEDLPFKEVAIVCRKGIWEKHGTATEQLCRNIDDFLVSGQNECAGHASVHIPATIDSMVAQTRATQERWPGDALCHGHLILPRHTGKCHSFPIRSE